MFAPATGGFSLSRTPRELSIRLSVSLSILSVYVSRCPQVKWGQDKSGDSTKRSLAKAVLWRVFAASNTLICGVFLAKDLSVASKIAGTDTIFKTVSVPRAEEKVQ